MRIHQSNEYGIVAICVDTAENRPSKLWDFPLREIIDFGNEFLLQYVSEWSAGHTPFDEPKNDRV